MASKNHVHHTTAGRVVYNRKTHLMGLRDAQRIVRFVLLNFREFNEDRKLSELRDEFFGIGSTLLSVTASRFSYYPPQDLINTVLDVLWQTISSFELEQINATAPVIQQDEGEIDGE